MAASNLSSYSTARSSDAPPVLASTNRTTARTAFVSQTPSATPTNSQQRPSKRKHSSEVRRENQTSQSGVNAVNNQQGRANVAAGQSSPRRDKSSGSASVQTYISALVQVLNLSERVVKDCADRLQSEGKAVTKDALFDECVKYEDDSESSTQLDYVAPTSSDFNSLPNDYENSLLSMPTLPNHSYSTSSHFSLPQSRSTTDFQPPQPPSSSVANTRSGKENRGSTSRHRHTARSRFSNANNPNSESETGVKQGFSRPPRDSHEGFSVDTGYSSMPSSSIGSSELSVSAQQNGTGSIGEDVPDGFFSSCLPFGSAKKDSSVAQTKNQDSSHTSKTSWAGSRNTSHTGAVTYVSTSDSLPRNVTAQINNGRHNKAPSGGRGSNSSFPQTSEDRRATNSGNENSRGSSSSASTTNTGVGQFSAARHARTSNKTPSISPMSRSEDNPDSGYGGETTSVLEREMESLQISETIASDDTARESREIQREAPADGNQAMARDEDMSHALTLLKAVQKENALHIENSLCTGCHERPRRVTHLPCGHFISCPQCADRFNNCQLCHASILATVDTYLA